MGTRPCRSGRVFAVPAVPPMPHLPLPRPMSHPPVTPALWPVAPPSSFAAWTPQAAVPKAEDAAGAPAVSEAPVTPRKTSGRKTFSRKTSGRPARTKP